MKKMKLVVIGNGMAGMKTVEELLKINPGLYDITVFGDEPYTNYNRIMLSPVLANEQTIDDIILNTREWYQENNITLYTSSKVNKIDRKKRVVYTDNGSFANYDRLLIATGSKPFMLPIPGSDLKNVIGYRDIKDTQHMIHVAKKFKKAVVIGGGLLGLEAANGLKIQGMDVTVVHREKWLLERQLDQTAGEMLLSSLSNKGIHFLLEKNTQELLPDNGRVSAVKFDDGSIIEADLVVMAVGIRPNIELAKSSGIYCDKGIVVNDTLQTYDPSIYAVGECVQHRNLCYGLVAPLFDMAKICANHLANYGIGLY
ncbi:MAG: NAD(P)/FAD-dependent oxidoreductase, partial [Nitrosomonadales bacterium]|nr:NAD(P)/FAD-dependent oxidoreductase [Nitrosomonadales bacterium]